MKDLSIIVAMTKDRVIGKDGKIPWHIPEDFKLFRNLTLGQTLIMGENTYRSIGYPLPKRNTVVLGQTILPEEGITIARTLEEALMLAESFNTHIYSAGGAMVYKHTLPLAKRLHISYVHGNYEGDTFFPEFEKDQYMEIVCRPGELFDYVILEKR